MRSRPSATALQLAARSIPLLSRPTTAPTLPAALLSSSRPSTPRASNPHGSRRQYASIPASQLQFGQPVHETHPEVLKPGEITPGITAQEYHDRRARLAQALPKNAVAILPAAEVKWRSGAVFFPFRQESNFLYLTGFNEPEALAVIQKTGDKLGDFLFHLFVRPKDPAAEQWSGPWSGIEAAEDVFNADHTGDIKQARKLLEPILRASTKIYTDTSSPSNKKLHTLLDSASPDDSLPISPLRPLLNNLRIIKSPAEIANMRHAGRVSGRAITDAMRRAWTHEKDLSAYLDHAFTKDGCGGPAYVPVVAGGSRANLIHYTLNNARLDPDELILVDAGGEYGTYITDITRTWPARGKFTLAQKDLYEAVLRVQRKGVALCRASSGMTLDGIHHATEAALKTELASLGFDMAGTGALEALFPHHVGHYVGLDVHDCPGYGRNVALRSGHCVTVEPGVYVPNDERFPAHFRGLGIRIEDSVCVDEQSPLVLTTEAVKEVVDIEALRDS